MITSDSSSNSASDLIVDLPDRLPSRAESTDALEVPDVALPDETLRSARISGDRVVMSRDDLADPGELSCVKSW
eukprot:CAMPEP_0184321036 /NCGR_PEP_ID=MMETSP1049-20130417/117068_1 /TAXON_ID=77928 /ORGANISM="Proteomonas sulcata, Strain CCMP704" /LENGTH=73 /DNA_ID=CAMNT_0026641719 /DNA_START=304 /DNA_END=522 /DNA_ORIENTATION=-